MLQVVLRGGGIGLRRDEILARLSIAVLRAIDFLPIFYGVGVITMFLTRDYQRLGVIGEDFRADPLEQHRLTAGNVLLVDDNAVQIKRIKASLPSIQYALDHGAALVLASHLGRPKGKPNPEMSLRPVAERLAQLLGKPVAMAPDCIGPEVEKMLPKPGEILLLENLRGVSVSSLEPNNTANVDSKIAPATIDAVRTLPDVASVTTRCSSDAIRSSSSPTSRVLSANPSR